MNKYLLSILTFLMVMQSFDVFAAGAAVRRRQQMQAMQQQAMQQAVMQQQYQVAQQQAQAQQVAQYQAAVQQQAQQAQIEAIAQYQQQQMQAQVQQILMQVQQEKAAYEQVKAIRQQQRDMVDAQEIAIATEITQKYQEAIMQEAARQKIALTAAQMARAHQLAQAQAEIAAMQAVQAKNQVQAQQVAQNRPYQPLSNDQIEDVVDISDVWRKLDVDSRAWTILVDEQAKIQTVTEYIDRYLKTGIRIQGSPSQYVQLIDQMAVENPSLLNNPFKNIIQLVAVMQYDFDNGMDKDTLAKKMLGQQLYEANRKRLGR